MHDYDYTRRAKLAFQTLKVKSYIRLSCLAIGICFITINCLIESIRWHRSSLEMLRRIVRVRHLEKYELELCFSDGTVASLDLHDRIVGRGGVFQPLQDVDYFSQVDVD